MFLVCVEASCSTFFHVCLGLNVSSCSSVYNTNIRMASGNQMKKTYVLDTNVLLSDAASVFAFEDNDVIIPMAVLEELDRHKSRQDEVGRNARQVCRTLDGVRTLGESLMKGVQLPGGGTLKVVTCDYAILDALPSELRTQKVDNLIVAFMLSLTKAYEGLRQAYEDKAYEDKLPTLVSKDINVRIKCDSLGIKCNDYLKMRVGKDPEKFYRGVDVIEVSDEYVQSFYDNGRSIVVNDQLEGRHLFANQIVVIKNVAHGQTTKSAITRYIQEEKLLVPVAKIENVFGLKPRNKEQTFAFDLLFDKNVKLVTLTGPAGVGKTLLTLASALEQLRTVGSSDVALYDRLIIMRPIQPVGKEIGFLPGTLAEKMEPWISPIKDNLNYLFGTKRPVQRTRRSSKDYGGKPRNDEGTYLSLLIERGLIEVEAITFIRGRSIPNSFIVIDEAQNLTVHELKTIVTRVGDGTKIVLTGDVQQIDNIHVDIYTNGLTYAIERFKEHPIAGHVTLQKGERSQLATIASQIL